MIYHFVVGDHAASPLIEAFAGKADAEVVVLKDILSLGPIMKAEGQTFTEMRKAFLQTIVAKEGQDIELDDMEHVLKVAAKMHHDETCVSWFWMAALPADVCAYYWMLPILSKCSKQFFVVNIAGLPFLNEEGKLFFPSSIATIGVKEVHKATKLARILSPSEIEVDTYEWKMLKQANAAVRTLDGGKKIKNETVVFYDNVLVGYCNAHFQKAHKIIGQAIVKNSVPTGDLYLMWRLKELVAAGVLEMKAEVGKSVKDIEVKLCSQNQAEDDEL